MVNKTTVIIDNSKCVHYLNQLYPDIYDVNGKRYAHLPKQILQDSVDKLDNLTL